jgi:hypothetical protein
MKVNNRQQLLIVLALLAVGYLLADRLIIGPLMATWKEHTKKITELKKSVAHGNVLLDREQIIRERWSGMRTNTLPDDLSAAQTQVLKAFDRWSEESRISISSIKSDWKRTASDEYMVLDCRADGFGSLESITRFLYEMEKDPLALRVESVEITSRDNTGQTLALGLEVTGLLLAKEAQQ